MSSRSRQFDLVSIGGGFAGLCAAVRGAELGLRTAVLEQGADDRYLCSSRWAGGIFHVSYHDVKLDPAELVAAINRQTGGEADPELAAAIAEDAGALVDWLAAQGAQFHPGQPDQLAPLYAGAAARRGRRPGLAGPRPRCDARRAADSGSRSARGGCFSAPARRAADERRALHRHRGARDGADFAAGAVVIADGGFPGNAELFRRHIGPRPDLVLQRHAGSAHGDGLRMAEAAGAALTRLDRFYGHLLSRDAMNNDGLWPYPQIDAVAIAGDRRRRATASACSTRGSAASRSPTTSPGSTTRSARP